MNNLFYKYEVCDRYGIEYTCIKWLDGSVLTESRIIDKPTSELTEEDLLIIQEFIDGGSVITDKTLGIEP